MVELGAILLLVAILVVLGTLAYGAISAAPWVPLPRRDVKRILDLVAPRSGETLFDLGCGDGRLLIAAAERYGVRAVGYELAVVPYLIAKLRQQFSPARHRIVIHYYSFWAIDLRAANAIVCFLTPYAMRRLKVKLETELAPGARFATYAFRIHGRPTAAVDRGTGKEMPIYLYT